MDDFFTLSDDFKIWLDLTNFRDWREVEADDASGVRRRGIFIPYLQNGIHKTTLYHSQLPRPILTLMARKPKNPELVKVALGKEQRRIVIPYIPGDNWKQMIREGLGREGDRYRGTILGFVYPVNIPLPGEDDLRKRQL